MVDYSYLLLRPLGKTVSSVLIQCLSLEYSSSLVVFSRIGLGLGLGLGLWAGAGQGL